MSFKSRITDFSVRHYKLVTIVMVVFTVALGAMIPRIKVDTDPENMLSPDEPVRVFHHETKEKFALNDIVVLGIVNNTHPEGVFNVESLKRVYEMSQFARTLRWPDPEHPDKEEGVVEVDILAPSMVDHISQGDPGVVKFEWLMQSPPDTEAEAVAIREKALSNPLLKDTLVSGDGKAICLYLPLTRKDLSYRVYSALKAETAELGGDELYYVTGLPVAEDTFGVEMFIQMAISAPLAMVVIFILMLLFFRKLVLVISPMIIAMVSVISTMGLLIGFGYPVHIMSSMIPIFLMPIAVVDSVHILSEFFDRYTPKAGRKDTIRQVMGNLFVPMLYTSLTSAAGFASLALTPIPPVQVFGIFVAVGIMIAWVFTVTFVPAYVMMIKESALANFGHEAHHADKPNALSRLLAKAGAATYLGAKPILAVMVAIVGVSLYGIARIQINDNPVKWFSKGHPIRQADIELNAHFGGTYMAYLVLEPEQTEPDMGAFAKTLRSELATAAETLKEEYPKAPQAAVEADKLIAAVDTSGLSTEQLLTQLAGEAEKKADAATDPDLGDAWYELASFFDVQKERAKLFKRPETLKYIAELQASLSEMEVVGKSNSVADVVRKVHQELIDGRPENYVIPKNPGVVAECLLQFQGSHNPDDLWHLVTNDYSAANIWIQLTSGDNRDMQRVVEAVETFFNDNPPPVPLKHEWAGLTYINIVWQDKMVWGMLQSFMGSFLIVFIMMAVLFRSPLWGIVCMIPLTITILTIYGIIGLVGKDYDMPVAVLSALTLGMAVDFAIHFLERARETYRQTGSWKASSPVMFGEPARAITRNVLVIAIGFLPLLAAPLVPYKTVGIFLCAIMGLSGAITLLVLPAMLRLLEKPLFKPFAAPRSTTCNCGTCISVAAAAVVFIALNLHQYWQLPWTRLAWIGLVGVPLAAVSCGMMSRRQACRTAESQRKETKPPVERKEQ
ncbi:MAG TPA: MMPL family transporter [Anaerohalosphaeraceae bacterium]|nr:MMPL family transporter [Anaerohalosphaeraceae bacterium]HRT52314.1 MMPL family transporter [Anaerohalosphaeraceae bacterium]HRT88317.1 MMPL family transporter [Anaerohalosphaeraceae bacterium]